MADSRTASLSNTNTEHARISNAEQKPVIVDIGKGSRKAVRRLRKGKPGKLMSRVEETIEHLREGGMLGAEAQPIVIVIRQRRRSRKFGKMLGLG